MSAILALAAALLLAPAALACQDPQTSQAFASSGDSARYMAVPGGSFEAGLSWSATGAPALVAQGNPLEIGGAGMTAVVLKSGDSITSPSICIDQYSPSIRFALGATDPHVKLKTDVLWTDDQGQPKRTALDDQNGDQYAHLGPSRVLDLKDAVPKDQATRDIRVRFSVEGGAGAWLIDNVSVAFAPPQTCPYSQTSQAFAIWGDNSQYTAVPGGSFEAGLSWSATGAPALVAQGNPLEFGGAGTTAVLLRSGDSITSASICIDHYYPSMRFALRATDPHMKLKTDILWTDDHGQPKQTALDDQDGNRYSAWGLSSIAALKDAVPQDQTIRDIRVRFSVEGSSGGLLIDDVQVDPYKRCC